MLPSFWQAELDVVRRHFELAVARYRAEYHPAHLLRSGQDPEVLCLARLANTCRQTAPG